MHRKRGKTSILELVTTIDIVGVTSFPVREKLREGETDGVKIAWLGDSLKHNFLNKTETDIASATLRIQKLKKSAFARPILAVLGDTAETAFAQFWELLKLQGSGQQGSLLVNGRENLVCIRDNSDNSDNNLRVVSAFWYTDRGGWGVDACSVEYSREWFTGSLIISH